MVERPAPPATDQQSIDLVDGFEAVYGRHHGARAAHARGHLCTVTFHPEPAGFVAGWLVNGDRHAVVRFSNGGGDPDGAEAPTNRAAWR